MHTMDATKMGSPRSNNTLSSNFLLLSLLSFFTITLSLSLPLLAISGPPRPEQLAQERHDANPQPRDHNARTTESIPATAIEVEPQLIAALDYGTFQGAYSPEFNISYWQKIPFAAPPVGQNRFRAPQPPVNLTALYGADYIYNSSVEFGMCPQRTANGSEDCLYLALYSRPWSPSPSPSPQNRLRLRPVVIVFHGGGFIRGSASFPSPSLPDGGGLPPSAYPVLHVSSSTDLVFIYPAYRTNAFGFLAGTQIVNDPYSDTNVGLLDQRAAIRWAKKYVHKFGGNPEDISIWGQSAGGGSVLAHVIADQEFDSDLFQGGDKGRKSGGGNGDGSGLFKKALLSSPYWPKTYSSTSPESQWIYDTLVNQTGCYNSSGGNVSGNSGDDTTLACLKSLPVQTIRQAAEYIASSHTYTTSSYSFAPVIDGLFLKKSLTEVVEETHPHLILNSKAVFATYNTHEGESFLPPDLTDDDDDDDENGAMSTNSSTRVKFTTWLEGFLPNLTEKDLQGVKDMYPPQGETGSETEKYSSVQARAGLIYRDVVLACPAYWITSAASSSSEKGNDRDTSGDAHKEGGGWLAEYTISPSKHASEVNWWNSPQPQQQTFPLIYKGFTGSFASFFATGDPNGHKLTPPEIAGVPELGTTNQEFVIRSDGFTTSKVTHLKARCDFWRQLAPRIQI